MIKAACRALIGTRYAGPGKTHNKGRDLRVPGHPFTRYNAPDRRHYVIGPWITCIIRVEHCRQGVGSAVRTRTRRYRPSKYFRITCTASRRSITIDTRTSSIGHGRPSWRWRGSFFPPPPIRTRWSRRPRPLRTWSDRVALAERRPRRPLIRETFLRHPDSLLGKHEDEREDRTNVVAQLRSARQALPRNLDRKSRRDHRRLAKAHAGHVGPGQREGATGRPSARWHRLLVAAPAHLSTRDVEYFSEVWTVVQLRFPRNSTGFRTLNPPESGNYGKTMLCILCRGPEPNMPQASCAEAC